MASLMCLFQLFLQPAPMAQLGARPDKAAPGLFCNTPNLSAVCVNRHKKPHTKAYPVISNYTHLSEATFQQLPASSISPTCFGIIVVFTSKPI